MENKKIEKRTVRPERIELARKLLQDLPEKDTRISKRETVARLENDILKALKKGYSPQEIAALLKTAGVIISAQLIKEVLEPDNKKEVLKEEAIEVGTDGILEDEFLETEIEVETKNVLKKTSEVNLTLDAETKESVLPNILPNILPNVLPDILKEDAPTRAELVSKVLEKAEAEKTMTNNSRGQFAIKPDRPKGEL